MKSLLSTKNLFFTAALGGMMLLNACKTNNECSTDADCATGEICSAGNCIIDPSTGGDAVQVSGFITSNTEWTADKIYILNGRVVVRSGATLKIQPGTIIKGAEGTGTSASVLIIERGGKIDARGTAAKPIIFTALSDNIKIGELAGTNLGQTDNELWGGLIVLGNAPVSTENGDVTGQIEGIPSNETYGVYGGSDPNDNSGYIEYVSIRHGGITIGDGNEINGLTLGGVGKGTSIHHIEVVANLDDGIEFFGGTVDVSDAIVVYQGDDAIDIDQNYSGTISNVMVITGDGIGTDEILEIDGPEGSTHTSGLFTITNGTFKSEGTEPYAGDFKSKAQGNVTLCQFIGTFNSKRNAYLAIRASFDDTTACTSKSDAYSYLTSTPAKLKIYNCDFIGAASIAAIAEAYNGSGGNCVGAAEQANVATAMSQNATSATGGRGADATKFNTWSWASIKGKL